MPTSPRLLARLALAAALAGCSASPAPSPAPPDAAPDASPDVATDASPDTPSDAPPDAGPLDAPAPDVQPDVFIPEAGPPDVMRPDATPDASPDAAPDAPLPDAPQVAYVAPGAGGRPAVWVQRLDGTMRRQLHFDGVTDAVPDQDDRVPPVSDARVIAVHYLAWSPDGAHVAAVVSTAVDQSEVVVLDAVNGGGAVASANGQYVMPALDWSADGRRLAFVMSTAPRAGGLELITADVPAHRWQFATRGASLRGLSVRVRFDPTGASVTYSRIDAEEPTNPWNSRSSLHRVTLATGADATLASDLVGRIDAIARDGGSVWLTRVIRATTGGSSDNAVIARTVPGGAETTLIDRTSVSLVAQGPYDGPLLAVDLDPSGSGGVHRFVQPGAPDGRVDLPPGAERAALWTPPPR